MYNLAMTGYALLTQLTSYQLEQIQTAMAGWTFESLQIVAIGAAATQHFPRFDPAQPVLLVASPAMYSGRELDRLAAILSLAYPPDHSVVLLGGRRDETTVSALPSLGSLQETDSLLIRPLEGAATYEALQDIAAHLRSPEGCPWDRALTWEKLRSTLLEEAYELLAALDAGDPRMVSEELGDLLLQVAMQTQIAAEEGVFRFPEVVRHVVDKLIRRHPHVFSDAVVSGTEQVLANWEAIKRAERARNGETASPLSGIPTGLPALAQADAYLDRVSRLQDVEAPDAPWSRLATLPSGTGVSVEEVGEALFGLVAWARARGIDAESALREANARYATCVASLDRTAS